MTKAEGLASEITARLARTINDWQPSVRVVDDPYGGVRILVSSAAFESRSWPERLRATFDGEPPEDVMWFDLVTPDEADEESERLLLDNVAQLPLWPNRLAARSVTEDLVLPSDLEEPIVRPFVVTLFSLRGGVGRSTALINAASLLATEGRRILCVDMDLEAPGLAALFGVESRVDHDSGVVRLLQQIDADDEVDIARHLIKVREADELYVLPAGVPDANYARRLATIDPTAWYEEDRNPFRILMDRLQALPIDFDVILLDARTGISPLNAPLLFDLSDMVVVVFFPHPQSIRGTEALTRAVLRSTTRRPEQRFTPELRFIISPVPAARDGAEGYWEERAKSLIAPWLVDANTRRKLHDRPQLDVDELVAVVSYSEQTAHLLQISNDDSNWQPYRPLADWIIEHLVTPTKAPPDISRALSNQQVLDSLSFSDGIAERADRATFERTFLSTSLVREALEPKRPIVIGRKGSGKSAIFRRLVDEGAAPGLAPRTDDPGPTWSPSADVFDSVEARMKKQFGTDDQWPTYWLFHIGLVLAAHGVPGTTVTHPVTGTPVELGSLDGLALVNFFDETIRRPDAALHVERWFERLAGDPGVVGSSRLVVFDGLDTGFGQSAEQRQRRARAVKGLIELTERPSLTRTGLALKLLIRDDIWRAVSVSNKSHFFGRSVTLAWDDQITFLKVALKQLLAADNARSYSSVVLPPSARALVDANIEIDDWDSDAVLALWRVFFGVRMSGGNTAFTNNWVWNRLSDSQGARSPRTLLQLCRLATERERIYSRTQAYPSSLLRPRALAESLPDVSAGAVDALREEFPELDATFDALRNTGKTPFPRTDLADGGIPEEELAVEIGLVSRVVATNSSDPDRFWVPEIYRIALGLTRRGQV
ncbi:MAG: hypothetical protein JWO62_1009 [Acidimicrobiaceae bacterium]|nr:hypothetical protein [Acidimicrobiaceae bacterium]